MRRSSFDFSSRHVIRAARVVALCGLLVPVMAEPANAEWQLAPFVGFTYLGNTSLFDPFDAVRERHWNFGGTARLVGAGPFGVESIFLYVPGYFERESRTSFVPDTPPVASITSSRSLAFMGNAVLTTPRTWNQYGLRPYVSGGIGLLHAYHDAGVLGTPLLPLRENLLGYNAGGGAVGFLTDRVGLRFDVRYYSNLRPSDESSEAIGRVRLHYWTGTIGVVFKY
jgi:hypothetical protein